MENKYKGILLHFDEIKHHRTVSNWQKDLLPQINLIAALYNDLGIDQFSQTAFNQLMAGGFHLVESQVQQSLDKDLQKLKVSNPIILDAMQQGKDKRLKPLEKALSDLKEKLRKARLNTPADASLPIELEDCAIIDGKATLKEDQLKQRFETKIETDKQAQLYSHYLNLQAAWNGYVDFLISCGYDVENNEVFGFDGFLFQDEGCQLAINHQQIDYFQ